MKTVATLTAIALSCGFASADHHKTTTAVAGVWNAVATSDEGDKDYILTLSQNGEELTGSSVAANESTAYTMDRITVEGKNVIFEFDFKRDGIEGVLKVVADEVSLGKLDGEWSVEDADGTVLLIGICLFKDKIQAACGPGLDGVQTPHQAAPGSLQD